MNVSDARKAHKILDDLLKGNMVLDEEREFLRSTLPEPPKQKTLEEIKAEVLEEFLNATGDIWGNDDVYLKDWLAELIHQLQGLKDTPIAVPALPAGMRLADHEEIGRVVVSPATDSNGERMIFCLEKTSLTGAGRRWAHEASLTFIDTAPAPPESLKTEADYRKAPGGTIAGMDGRTFVFQKYDNGEWRLLTHDRYFSDSQLARVSRRILRWGWGE